MWPFLLTAGAGIIWGVCYAMILRRSQQEHRILCWLFAVLPFFSGGYYTFLSVPVSALLLILLLQTVRKNGYLRLFANFGSISIGAVGLVLALCVIWAVDRGMAPMGFVRFLPVVLLTLLLMQLDEAVKPRLYEGIPLAGTMMTVCSISMMFLPTLTEIVAPDGRLAGFMEYPNTFALFLLIGVILSLTGERPGRREFLNAAVCMFGIMLSGSRTTFILLVVSLAALCLSRKRKGFILGTVGILALVLLLSTAADKLSLFQSADRYLTTSAQDSTFLVRLLYFKDALKVILRHPLGLGYMGYANLQGSFQNGVYHVTYVHNELLQLLLDVGWIPVILLLLAFIKAFFKKNADSRTRLLMFAILGHCMMDFDLQFLSVWFLLIPLLELHTGTRRQLSGGRSVVAALGSLAVLFSLWLGIGDLCHNAGWSEACLKVYPFHTTELVRQLPGQTDLAALDETADRILALDSHVSLAHSAKANTAYASGDILSMMESKKAAIANARYTLEEYTDYFDKLYQAMELYAKQGDTVSAEICRQELLKIPKMLSNVLEDTDPLAWKVQHVPELELPQEYQDVLTQLEG